VFFLVDDEHVVMVRQYRYVITKIIVGKCPLAVSVPAKLQSRLPSVN
jgi:hypothetical protein